MSEITIRHSEKKDIQAIKDIYAGQLAYSGTLQLPFPSLAIWEKYLESSRQGFYSLVADVEGVVVGHILLYTEQNMRRKHVAGFGIAVKDGFHKRGIGSQLMSSAIDLAENWLNIQRIEIMVFTDNKAAISLYKKHGFIIEGESSKFAFKNGEFISAFHMARLK